MVVTVIISGVPRHEHLKRLSKEFDQIFDRDDIGSFRVRELNEYTSGKRQLALDFQSGYDAMNVQQILDGHVYRSDDNDVSIFKARVLKNTNPQSSMEIVSSSSSSRASTFGMIYHTVSSEELLKTTNDLDAQLQLLEKQKLVLKAERELIKEKKKLDREYSSKKDAHDSDEEITYKSKKRSKKRNSSDSSEDSRRRARSKSPKYRRMRSPSRRRSPSPVHHSRRRLSGSVSRSPMGRRSRSPSHGKWKRRLSPASSRDKISSPSRRGSPSPVHHSRRRLSGSVSRSSMERRSRSPLHGKRPRKLSPASSRDKTRPPSRRGSPSPVHHNRRRLSRSISRSLMDRRSRSPPHRQRERMLSPASPRDKTWSQEASTSRSSNKNKSRRYRKPKSPKSSSSYGREEIRIVIDLTDSVETKKPNEDRQKVKAIQKTMDSIISNGAALNNLSEDSSKHVTGILKSIVEKRITKLPTDIDVSSADALLRCYQDHHKLDHDRLMLKEMAQIYVNDPYSQTPVVVPAYEPVASSTQNDNIWNAVDEVLQDVQMDVFETNDVPSKVKIDKPVPENAQFVTPVRIIMRQMKKHVTEIEKECKQIYQVARQVIRDRIKEMMVGEDYTRSTEIVFKYRKVYDTNGDEDFLKKLRDEINAGKYAEPLEVKGSEPLPEKGDEENVSNQMTTEDILLILQNQKKED